MDFKKLIKKQLGMQSDEERAMELIQLRKQREQLEQKALLHLEIQKEESLIRDAKSVINGNSSMHRATNILKENGINLSNKQMPKKTNKHLNIPRPTHRTNWEDIRGYDLTIENTMNKDINTDIFAPKKKGVRR